MRGGLSLDFDSDLEVADSRVADSRVADSGVAGSAVTGSAVADSEVDCGSEVTDSAVTDSEVDCGSEVASKVSSTSVLPSSMTLSSISFILFSPALTSSYSPFGRLKKRMAFGLTEIISPGARRVPAFQCY